LEVLANAGIMALASMFVGVLPLTMGIVYAIWPNEQRLMLARTQSQRDGNLLATSRDRPCRIAGSSILRLRMSDGRLALRDPRALATSMSL
jgi:hypothetical protein